MFERYFRTIALEEAKKFMDSLNPAIRNKLVYKIDKAETTKDPVIFKEAEARHLGI